MTEDDRQDLRDVIIRVRALEQKVLGLERPAPFSLRVPDLPAAQRHVAEIDAMVRRQLGDTYALRHGENPALGVADIIYSLNAYEAECDRVRRDLREVEERLAAANAELEDLRRTHR